MASPLEDYLNSQYGEDQGTISKVLSYFNRPLSAVAGAFAESDPWAGFTKGITGDKEYSWGDVVGIDAPSEQDDWGTWLAKGGGRLALDIVGDPLNLLFGAGAITKGLGLSSKGVSAAGRMANALGKEKAMQYFAGTSMGKALSRSSHVPELEDAIQASFRDANLAKMDSKELALKASEIAARTGMDPADINELWARGGTGLSGDLTDLLRQQHGLSRTLATDLSDARQTIGMSPLELRSEADVTHIPRIATDRGSRLAKEDAKYIPDKGVMQPFKSRTLMVERGTEGTASPRIFDTRYIDMDPVTKQWSKNGQQLDLIEATYQDIVKSGVKPDNFFIPNAPESYYFDQAKKLDKLAVTKTLKAAVDMGQVQDVTNGINKGWRALEVPGLQGFQAPKHVANRLENIANRYLDPNTNIGAIGEALKSFNNTRIGQGLQDFNRLWKTTTLPLHFGFHAGNVGSNLGLQYLNEVNPLTMPIRNVQGRNLLKDPTGSVIDGITNKDLLKEAMARGAVQGTGFFGSEFASGINKILDTPGKLETLTRKIPGIGNPLATGSKYLHEKGFQAGTYLEDSMRAGLFIDKLKKIAPDFANLGHTERAVALDKAAKATKSGMVDFTNLTPFEKELRNIVPFLGWQSGVVRQFGEQALRAPQRIGRLDRAINTVFDPLSEEDQNIADPWIQGSNPTTAMFGSKYGLSQDGLPQMFQLGRYMPYGQLDQFLAQPAETLLSVLSPMVKAGPEVLSNRNYFKNRGIDEAAGSFPGNIINPLTNWATGQPYELANRQMLGFDVPNIVDYGVNLLPGARYLNELQTVGQSLGVLPQDPYRSPQEPSEALSWYATGGKLMPFDQAKYLKHRERDYKATERNLKAGLKYAATKGDPTAQEHYVNMLMEHAQRKARVYGFTEAD